MYMHLEVDVIYLHMYIFVYIRKLNRTEHSDSILSCLSYMYNDMINNILAAIG